MQKCEHEFETIEENVIDTRTYIKTINILYNNTNFKIEDIKLFKIHIGCFKVIEIFRNNTT